MLSCFARSCNRAILKHAKITTSIHITISNNTPSTRTNYPSIYTISSNNYSPTLSDPYSSLYSNDTYNKITEIQQFSKLIQHLSTTDHQPFPISKHNSLSDVNISEEDYLLLFDSALITHCLHIQARIASFEGQGYYTIGPCGEEYMASIGLCLAPNDAISLHYRHLATLIARLLKRNDYKSQKDIFDDDILHKIITDRARGYCMSSLDIVSAGSHCLLGSNDHTYDYLTTSTLASQLPPALGRALGSVLYHAMQLPDAQFSKDFVSYVSTGDGSVNNAHFLSAMNLMEYITHRNVKCPLLIGISNNRLCISLKDDVHWLRAFLNKFSTPKFMCDGTDLLDVYSVSNESLDYVRKCRMPAIIVFDDIVRQFGHAATDRQTAYLTDEEIQSNADTNMIKLLCDRSVQQYNILSYEQCLNKIYFISSLIKNIFEEVYLEPKLTVENRLDLRQRVSQPLLTEDKFSVLDENEKEELFSKLKELKNMTNARTKKHMMRKLMNYAIEETLIEYKKSVYIGEDVIHGGYYLVTDGLADRYPRRVADFPPDETSILGTGIGYAQSGLLPIVEMPYAKYLDCGADMFFEACIMNWLSNHQQPNGMIIRLQGFGNGVFGGNFHTHNSLYLPPGLDVVCCSNGADYIRMWRYIVRQANIGRVCMSVDCTQLLNQRHIYNYGINEEKDGLLMQNIVEYGEYLTFDDIIIYNQKREKYIVIDGSLDINGKRVLSGNENEFYLNVDEYLTDEFKLRSCIFVDGNNKNKKKIVIISYGVSVNTARQAQNELLLHSTISDVIVIDTPYLTDIPAQLKKLLAHEQFVDEVFGIVFADMCKEGQNPMNGFVCKLQQLKILQKYEWISVAAQYTYNPLGKEFTFLSTQDIVDAALSILP